MATTAERLSWMEFNAAEFESLLRRPDGEVQGKLKGNAYTARVAIPCYGERIARHYRDVASSGLAAACAAAEIPFNLCQFGLIVTFAKATEILIHNGDMTLDDSVRAMVDRFGPVIFRNAHVANGVRGHFHRNIFPHLRFHVDRGPTMPNQFSCFTRDPFDLEQRCPRATSTLFVANIVAWLEMVRTKACEPGEERGVRMSCDLFAGVDMDPLIGELILEQPWNEPEGTGEIVVVDNRTALHATYHKDGRTAGYRIGARYLV